jgi:dihydropteroate synthase
MGIVNVTPDSFSDGGKYFSAERAIEHGLKLKAEGAQILDIGGESTRPGSTSVTLEEELARVMPVLDGLRDAGAAISVDTMKPGVMSAVLQAGADMINDVNAFQSPGAIDVVAPSNCGLSVMHMRGTPKNMQVNPIYEDVVADVLTFLRQRLDDVQAVGVDLGRVLIDPGFGFGKAMEHNLALFKSIDRLTDMAPVLVGVSRKSFLGVLAGRDVGDRLIPGVIAALMAVQSGVAVVRVHDVRETVAAIRIWREMKGK